MFSTLRYAWSRIRTIARPYRQFQGRWRGVALFVGLVTLILSARGADVGNNYINGDMMSALEARDARLFFEKTLLFVGMLGVVTVLAVFARYFEERLGLLLREGLTHYLIQQYLSQHVYDRLTRRPDIDNPDQRITEDVKNFTSMA